MVEKVLLKGLIVGFCVFLWHLIDERWMKTAPRQHLQLVTMLRPFLFVLCFAGVAFAVTLDDLKFCFKNDISAFKNIVLPLLPGMLFFGALNIFFGKKVDRKRYQRLEGKID